MAVQNRTVMAIRGVGSLRRAGQHKGI